MSEQYNYDSLRATRKSERREKQRNRKQTSPIVARYDIWTGDGVLRAGEGLEKRLAKKSVKMSGITKKR